MQLPDLTNNKASTGGQGQCPPGQHLMRATEVKDVGPNQKGNSGVQVVWSALDPEIAGFIARDNFTLISTSGGNVEVGKNRIKGLLTVLGLPTSGDTAMIHGHACMVRVIQEDYTPEPGRTVKTSKATGYEAAQHGIQAAQPPQAAQVVIDAADAPF